MRDRLIASEHGLSTRIAARALTAGSPTVDEALGQYPRASMMWGSMRVTARKHAKDFWRGNRYGAVLLWRHLRAEGFTRFLFDMLMHLPVVLIGISLFVVVTNRIQSVHQSGYAVGAVVFAFACTSLMASTLMHLIGVRWLLGLYALLNIPAVLYLMWLSGDAEQIGTIKYALVCLFTGVTLPPWSVLSQRHRASMVQRSHNAVAIMAWSNIANLSMYPLAAFLMIPAFYYGGIRSGLLVAVALDALLLMAVLVAPKLLPLLSREHKRGAVPYGSSSRVTQQVTVSRYKHSGTLMLLLVLGLAMLGACIGSTATGLLGFSTTYDSLYLYPMMIAVATGMMVIVAVPILLGSSKIVPWQGWLVSAIVLVFAAMFLPVSSSLEGTFVALALFGASLGAALAGQSMTLSLLIGRTPDTQIVFFARSMSAVGITMGSMWGGFMGDGMYYRNAFMVPVIAACLYLVLGHLFGYVWRLDYEEHLAPLSEEEFSGHEGLAQKPVALSDHAGGNITVNPTGRS